MNIKEKLDQILLDLILVKSEMEATLFEMKEQKRILDNKKMLLGEEENDEEAD